jgi:RNA ligase (TIGR02306 family)
MSTHQVHIITIDSVLPHDNADSLEIIPINGWSVVVRKADYTIGQRAIYIEPDYLVPTDRPYFAFLAKPNRTQHRLRAIRLRGVVSFGLLISVPPDLMHIVDSVQMMEALGVQRYEPPVKFLAANALPDEEAPPIYCPKFDIESFKNFPHLIKEGEEVIITEKIHGANARYLWTNDKLYIGSRNRWIDPNTDSVWRAAYDSCPAIERWITANPDTILFGEIFGKVQSLSYGRPNSVDFRAFAALSRDKWINQDELFASASEGLKPVPILYQGPFKLHIAAELAEEDSLVDGAPAGHMREGVVVVPSIERFGPSSGRTALKLISNRYWLSDND